MIQKWDEDELGDGMEAEDGDGEDMSNMDDLNYIH